jgi:LemA protein
MAVVITAVVVAVLVVVILIWWITVMNRFRRLSVKINEAESGIDVALTKRFDALTKMSDTVKSYVNYEKSTLLEVVRLRAGMSMPERSEANRIMDEVAKQINILAEQYPALQSSQNLKQLQLAVMDVEEHLQAARRAYNANVSAFNQAIVVFPSSIVAGALNYSARLFFEGESAKRQDVNVSF